MNHSSYHVPVLKDELIRIAKTHIQEKKDIFIVDGTLGDAGHSIALLNSFPNAQLLALDHDSEMIHRASQRLQIENFSVIHSQISEQEATPVKHPPHFHREKQKTPPPISLWNHGFHRLPEILSRNHQKADLILLDLGVSLYHLKEAGRGFSYQDECLDMRFHKGCQMTASDWINHSSAKELASIFSTWGEEPYSYRIAKRIVENRPFDSARELATLIMKSIPPAKQSPRNRKSFGKRQKKIHPATRIFQALRIAVNDELRILDQAMRELPSILSYGGILAVISFHSLEDRIVKHRFREIGLPIGKDCKRIKEERNRKDFVILTNRPIRPQEEESKNNPSSRSACLRVLMRKMPSQELSSPS